MTVVNSARVSFNKHKDLKEFDGRDEKLISYLATHNHWTPFAHCQMTLRVKAPIFVARQLGKHQVGAVWNEISRRYVDSEPEFFYPDKWRGRPVNMKQGSSDVEIKMVPGDDHGTHEVPIDELVRKAVFNIIQIYNMMIAEGVAPEQARMILPQNMMTEWYWTGSLSFFKRVCELRLDPHSQDETRQIAVMIDDIVKKEYPISWKYLLNSVDAE